MDSKNSTITDIQSDQKIKGIITVILSIITPKIVNYFDLGQMYHAMIYEALKDIVDWGLLNLKIQFLIDILNHIGIQIDHLWYFAMVGLFSYFIYYYWRQILIYFNKKEEIKQSSAMIYNLSVVKDISEYMRLCPENFKNLNSFKIGDPKLISKLAINQKLGSNYEYNTAAYARSPQEDHPIIIDDKKFNVTGLIYWRVHVEKVSTKTGDISTEEDFSLKYVEIFLDDENESSVAVENYIDKIKSFLDDVRSNEITRHHVKILADPGSFDTTNDLQLIYRGPTPNLEEREKQFIKTFFHPKRDVLWEVIKRIQTEPNFYYSLGQAPQIGLLLYGPPGTGKSSFAYRVAMALNRNIVSVDIRTVKYKSKLWQIIKRPRVQTQQTSKECVFIFDEFDLTVRDLYYRDQYNKGIINHWITKMNSHIDTENNLGMIDLDDIVDNDQTNNQNKKKKKNNNDYPSLNINHEEIQLSDLLEIFQGPVPIDGLIAIATTNHFDEINRMCPALFRPGRLTPVNFDYANKETILDMSHFYFKKMPTFEIPEKTNIPTSQIIEIVQESKVNPLKEFEIFCDKLKKLL